jgi:hypothetical protein
MGAAPRSGARRRAALAPRPGPPAEGAEARGKEAAVAGAQKAVPPARESRPVRERVARREAWDARGARAAARALWPEVASEAGCRRLAPRQQLAHLRRSRRRGGGNGFLHRRGCAPHPLGHGGRHGPEVLVLLAGGRGWPRQMDARRRLWSRHDPTDGNGLPQGWNRPGHGHRPRVLQFQALEQVRSPSPDALHPVRGWASPLGLHQLPPVLGGPSGSVLRPGDGNPHPRPLPGGDGVFHGGHGLLQEGLRPVLHPPRHYAHQRPPQAPAVSLIRHG